MAKSPSRRAFWPHVTGGAIAMLAISRLAWALDYPTRPVRIIVTFGAGSASDIAARLLGQYLSERLGQPFVVENRTGAGGNIGTEAVVKSAPDGYTLLIVNPPNTINTTLYDNLNFNFLRDITAVAMVYRQPLVMEVNLAVPAKTVPEFVAYAKSKPGKINIASLGIGTPQHMAGELFKRAAGIDLVHVPYRGGPLAIADLIGGQVQVMFDVLISSIEHVRAGKLRALATTMTTRSEVLPEIPTVAESIPGYNVTSWLGVGAPKGTPSEIVERLNKEINEGLNDPKLRARFTDLGVIVSPVSPEAFGTFMADETAKWAEVIRAANIKPE